MSLRLKIVLALTLLAATATVAIGVFSYRTTRHELEGAVDRSLALAATSLEDRVRGAGWPQQPGRERPRAFEQVLYQFITPGGVVIVQGQADQLPITSADLAVAAGEAPGGSVGYDTQIDGEPFRVLTVQRGPGALQLARSLAEVERALDAILRRTLVAVTLVAAVSVLLGWLIARQITRRLLHLTVAAGVVADTGNLEVDVPVDGADETGQLGRAFSSMLNALRTSKHAQQQLVQDAGHELRTPLTSLTTNVAVLRRNYDELPPDARAQLLADLDSETRELTVLVNELVELATDQHDGEEVRPVLLRDVAERAAARARRRFDREVTVQADDSTVDGRPQALERAMQNLVDNACKFAPSGPVEVVVAAGEVCVRDHGPGLIESDIPHLFDRFYRSVAMRSTPGSGLGLSIAKSVADAHGGSVFARNAANGGAELGFTLPLTAPEPGPEPGPVT